MSPRILLVAPLALTLLACVESSGAGSPSAAGAELGGGGAAPLLGDGGSAARSGAPAGGHGGEGGSAEAHTGNEATLLTWNLENFPHSAEASATAAELLGALSPDVAALEEIADADAFDDLLDALPGYDGFLNWDYGAYQRLGLLYRTERVTVLDVETIFRDDWYAFPRPPLTARLAIDAPTPIDFTVVVVHLKAMLDDESQDRRREGCARLDQWVRAEQLAGEEQDFVLLGDFNDQLTDPAADNVFMPFLGAPDDYRALTLPLAESGMHSYIPYESLIDHVIVTADMLPEVGTGETEVLPLDETVSGYRELSDHRPVRTRLAWGAR